MAKARYVRCEVLYDGLEVGLSRRLESLSYTDNDSGVSDEIVLTFCQDQAEWLMKEFMPEKEHDLDVTLWLYNWRRSGDCLRYHCGNFTLDDITFSGSPRQCIIKGVSVPAGQAFQSDPVCKTWKKVTLKQIAQEILNKYGMRKLHYHGTETILEVVEQNGLSDSAFLYDICEKQGMYVKIYKKDLVIFDKMAYEPRGTTADFTESDFETWSWNSTLNSTYTGAAVSYTIPEKKQTIDVAVGQGPRILHINERADSEGEAIRIAKAKVNRENEKAVTMSFNALGNPDVVATCNIGIYGMGRCDGKYFVTKVRQRVTGSGGYTMGVSGYRIFDRLQ